MIEDGISVGIEDGLSPVTPEQLQAAPDQSPPALHLQFEEVFPEPSADSDPTVLLNSTHILLAWLRFTKSHRNSLLASWNECERSLGPGIQMKQLAAIEENIQGFFGGPNLLLPSSKDTFYRFRFLFYVF